MDFRLLHGGCGVAAGKVAACRHRPSDSRIPPAAMVMAKAGPMRSDPDQPTRPRIAEAGRRAPPIIARSISRGDGRPRLVGRFRRSGWIELPAARIDARPALWAVVERTGTAGCTAREADRHAMSALQELPEPADPGGRRTAADPGGRACMRRSRTTSQPRLHRARAPEPNPQLMRHRAKAPEPTPPLPDRCDLILDAPAAQALPWRRANGRRHWRGIHPLTDATDGGCHVAAVHGAGNQPGRRQTRPAVQTGATRRPSRHRSCDIVFSVRSIRNLLSSAATIDAATQAGPQWIRRLPICAHGLDP